MGFQQIAIVFVNLVGNTVVFALLDYDKAPFTKLATFLPYARKTKILLLVFPVLVFVGIFIIYQFPVTGDVTLFYLPQGKLALEGKIPTKDFNTSYMFFFPYLMGFVSKLGNANVLAIPLFFTFLAILNGFLFFDIAQTILPLPEAHKATWVAFLTVPQWLYGIGYQQDEVLLLFFTLLSLWLINKEKYRLSGILLAVGFWTTKSLFLITILVFLIVIRRMDFSLAVLVTASFLFMVTYMADFSIIRMLSAESGSHSPPSFSNIILLLPFMKDLFRQHSVWVYLLIVSFSIGPVFLFAMRFKNVLFSLESLIYAYVFSWLVFLILSPKSLPPYRLLIFPFLPLILYKLPFGKPGNKHILLVVLLYFYATALGVHSVLYEHLIGVPYPSYLQSDNFNMFLLLLMLVLDTAILVYEFGVAMMIKKEFLSQRRAHS